MTVIAVGLASQGAWWQAGLVAGIVVLYLLVVRLTRCRVETTAHRPCLWRVRGLLGTCDYHVGYKRGLPILIRGQGFLGLPMFMWPRDDFVGVTAGPERQPMHGARGSAATAEKARRAGYDWVMMVIAVVGVVIALATFVQGLLPK
ncbi:MAG TPA: hypothetical protein VHX38_36340 [Pseudonocardiaceae bacterium]|nr:hypothetical protein [Pseudonocardiaceae bacterium]